MKYANAYFITYSPPTKTEKKCPSSKIKDNEKLDQRIVTKEYFMQVNNACKQIKEKQKYENENTMTRNVMA